MAQAGTALSVVLRPNTLLAQDTNFRSRALTNGVAKELSANAKQRGLRYWMVTCFDLVQFKVPQDDERFQYMVYQVENCPTTKRDHIQGYLELNAQTRFLQVKAMFAPAVVHLEGRKAKNAKPAIDYCMKEETRVSGPWEFGTRPDEEAKTQPKIDWISVREKVQALPHWRQVIQSEDPEIVRATASKLNYVKELHGARDVAAFPPNIVLRKWQKKVLAMLDEPPVKRRIIWIWSEKSGTGKTTFFDYVSSKYDVLPGADWANTLFVYDGQSVIWYDRTRAQSTDFRGTDLFYSDLERFSNCSVHTSTKYQGTRKHVNAHVVVTANAGPDDFRLPQRFVVIEAKTAEEEQAQADAEQDEFEDLFHIQHQMDIDAGYASPLENTFEEEEEETSTTEQQQEISPDEYPDQKLEKRRSKFAHLIEQAPSPDLFPELAEKEKEEADAVPPEAFGDDMDLDFHLPGDSDEEAEASDVMSEDISQQ